VVPYSLYFASKLKLRYAALTLTLMTKGSLMVSCSLEFFAVFSRTEKNNTIYVCLLSVTRNLRISVVR